MIGSAFKKLANENGMSVSHGVAYGSLQGYAATLSEGSGYKLIVFSTSFPDATKKGEFLERINSLGEKQLNKEYRVNRFGITESTVEVLFQDTVGTMKKIEAFLQWFLPLLGEYGAAGVDVCPECGCQITDGSWVMVDGICHHVHGACADKIGRILRLITSRKSRSVPEATCPALWARSWVQSWARLPGLRFCCWAMWLPLWAL